MPRLRDLRAYEVSLVPRAANMKKFLILKSEGGNILNIEEILKSLGEIELDEKEKIEEILKAKKMTPKVMEAVQGAYKILNQFKKEMPQDIMGILSSLMGYEMPKEPKLEIEMGKAKGGPGEMKKEDIEQLKVNDEVKEALSKLWKQNEDVVKKNEMLEGIINKQEDVRLTQKYVDVAKSYTNISVDVNEFGKILKEVAMKAPDAIEKIQEVLNSSNELLKDSSIMKELGSSAPTGANAWAKIEKMADEIVKTDKVTKAVAITKAMENNPELYTEYLKEGGNY